MAKQGYFSGKTEYDKQRKDASGGTGKRTSGSDTRGYSKRGESGQRAYQDKPGYRGEARGASDGERKPYYGNKNDGGYRPHDDNRQTRFSIFSFSTSGDG